MSLLISHIGWINIGVMSGRPNCRRYGIKTLVLAEPHDEIEFAIAREKALKAWKRTWKIELIESVNPAWEDLFDRIA